MRKILSIIIILLPFSMITRGQVITQIGKENMKFATEKKKDQPSLRATDEIHVNVDSTSLYYVMIDSAQSCIEKHDWAAAELYFRKALAADPASNTNSMLLSNLATVQRYQGKLNEALKNYTLALDLTPNAVTLLLNRAALLLETGKTEEAIADFQRVRRQDVGDAESRYSLGMIAIENGDLKTAEEMFNEIKIYSPKSALSYEGFGMLYKKKGEYEKAIDQLSQVIKAHPDARLLGNRADCYLAIKRLNDATADIHQALQLDPDDGYLYVLRAKLNKLRYNRTEMERDVDLAVSHGVDRHVVEQLLEIPSK